MSQTVDLVRTEHTARTADELLRAGVSALLGVSSDGAQALNQIGVVSVFDLAASRVFSTARRLSAIASDDDHRLPESRLGVVLGETVDAPADVEVKDLASEPLSILRAIGPGLAPTFAAALGTDTVRDLAQWPPSLAARAVLAAAFFPDQASGFDPDAPADLLPLTGIYPTERVFYRALLIDGPVDSPDNALPIEQLNAAVDIVPGLLNPTGFQQVSTGALLSFSQSWFSQGLTLGQLLHSTALAPGESTRIAMIDWTRRSTASTTESIDETEQLSNTQTHNRALTEVTSATATEFQTGSSTSTVTSDTSQLGGGFGLEIGPLALGGSGGTSTTTTDAFSASSSFGQRDIAADYAQRINDRTQQHASSSRSRRASIVREVSQTEHESISTRVVTNYNHMHALSVQYYEVVQAFRTTTQLERAERCLFLPVTLLELGDLTVVELWRAELSAAALTPAIGRALAELGTVRVISTRPHRRLVPTKFLYASFFGNLAAISTDETGAAAPPPATDGSDNAAPAEEKTPYVAASSSRIVRLAQAGWQLDQIERLGRLAGRVIVPTRLNTAYLTDDALLLGVGLRAGQATGFGIKRRDGTSVPLSDVTATSAAAVAPVAVTEVASISVGFAGAHALTTSLTLQLSLFGTVETLDVPIELAPGGGFGWQDCVLIELPTGTRDLVDHLKANALHYTQAILRRLDGPAIAAILARFTYRGIPLAQLVDHRPVGVTSNLLVFRMNMPSEGDAPDRRLAEVLDEWRAFLVRTGLDRPVPRTEIVPLPSGGVFAEAVIGRFNSAEELDITRFWNWQDSPIPLVASEIAPVQAGSRSQAEDLLPGQLSAPVVNIQQPTALPDPTGIAAVVAALQSGSAFRDMSGLAQTAALAQAAQTASAAGATAVAQQAAQNLETVMSQNTERLRIAAQVAAAMMGMPVSGAAGGKPPAGRTPLPEYGGALNKAKELDAKAASSPEQATASAEREVFQTQMKFKGQQIAGKVLEAAGFPKDLVPSAPAPAPAATRTVGPTLVAPQPITFTLHVSSRFTNATVFAPGVELDISVRDLGGKTLLQHRGPPAVSVTGTLNTSDQRLFLNVRYGYDLQWPQPTRIVPNVFVNLDAPPGTRRIEANITVMTREETITGPATLTIGDDAALTQLLKENGIDLRRVLHEPLVTASTDGGFNIAFKYLQSVGLEQVRNTA